MRVKIDEFYSDLILENITNLILESKVYFSTKLLGVLGSINSPIAKKLIDMQGSDQNLQYNYIDSSAEENDVVSFIPDRKAQEILNGTKNDLFKIIDSDRHLTNSPKNAGVFSRLGVDINIPITSPEEGWVGKILKETYGTNGKVYVLFQVENVNSSERDEDDEDDEDDNSNVVGKKLIINREGITEFDNRSRAVWSTSRNKIKIGRLVRAILNASKEKFQDKDIEVFVNSYKSTIDVMNDALSKFEIISGEELLKFYHHRNYSSDGGTLGNSCMASATREMLRIYWENPDVVKMVVLYDDSGSISDGKYRSNKIKGRALLWKVKSGSENLDFMDRIYTHKDSDVQLFIKFAEKNKFWHKLNQDSSDHFTVKQGEQRMSNVEFVAKLSKWDDSFPYLDSLCYFNNDSGEISNNAELIQADYSLHDTSGGYDHIDGDYDDYDD